MSELDLKGFSAVLFLIPFWQEKKKKKERKVYMGESHEAENPAFTLHSLSATKGTRVTQSISWPQHHSHSGEGLLAVPAKTLYYFSCCLYLDAIFK